MKKEFLKIRRVLSLTLIAALGAGTLASTSQPVSAEKKAGQAQKRNARMEAMEKRLNLTDDQRTRLKAIMTESRQQSKAVRNDKALTETQKKEKMRTIRQNSREKMNAVLTDTQRKEFDKMRRENRGQKGGAKHKPKA